MPPLNRSTLIFSDFSIHFVLENIEFNHIDNTLSKRHDNFSVTFVFNFDNEIIRVECNDLNSLIDIFNPSNFTIKGEPLDSLNTLCFLYKKINVKLTNNIPFTSYLESIYGRNLVHLFKSYLLDEINKHSFSALASTFVVEKIQTKTEISPNDTLLEVTFKNEIPFSQCYFTYTKDYAETYCFLSEEDGQEMKDTNPIFQDFSLMVTESLFKSAHFARPQVFIKNLVFTFLDSFIAEEYKKTDEFKLKNLFQKPTPKEI